MKKKLLDKELAFLAEKAAEVRHLSRLAGKRYGRPLFDAVSSQAVVTMRVIQDAFVLAGESYYGKELQHRGSAHQTYFDNRENITRKVDALRKELAQAEAHYQRTNKQTT